MHEDTEIVVRYDCPILLIPRFTKSQIQTFLPLAPGSKNDYKLEGRMYPNDDDAHAN